MTMAAQKTAPYFRFLERKQSINVSMEIDPNEAALLEVAILHWAKGEPMTVRQTVAVTHLGSPATLHKRLMRLRAGNFLQLQDVAGDRRVKHVVAGPRGISYIKFMSRFMSHYFSAKEQS